MHIKTKSKIKNKFFIIGASGLALIVCGLVAFYVFSTFKSNPIDNSQTSTPDRSETDIQQSQELESQPANKETQNNTDIPTPIKTDKDSGKSVVQMITSFDISNDTLYIRGGINNSVEYDGICFAELIAPNGEIIKKETTLLQNSATTDCKTISIPLTELPAGHWKFTLNYTSNNKTGKSNEGSFDI